MIGTNVYAALKKSLETNNLSTLIGDEGGFSPKVQTNQDALLMLKQVIEGINLRLGFDVFLGLDAASGNFFMDQQYHIRDKSIGLSSKDLISFYKTLNNDYHLLYLEDGLAEDDWTGWSELYGEMSQQTVIVGDDLTATNPYRLQMALDKKTITGIIIKPKPNWDGN